MLLAANKLPCQCSGIFDGHGGEAAADYLRKNFYKAFSSLVSEEAYAEECSVEGRSSIFSGCASIDAFLTVVPFLEGPLRLCLP